MKKLIALCVAVALLNVAPALAAEWKDGRSPEQPFPGKPAADFTRSVGYIMVYPHSAVATEGGCRRLRIWLPRMDVKAGHGSVIVKCVDDGTTWTIACNDSEYVQQRDMDEEELNYLSWGSGTCFEITLPVSLSQYCDYTVEMEADCIISNDNAVSNPARGPEKWSFATDAAYGMWDMQYVREKADGSYEEGIMSPTAGDEIRMNIALGGGVAKAVLQPVSGVEFDESEREIRQSGAATGYVTASNPTWRVIFYDANDEIVDAVQP